MALIAALTTSAVVFGNWRTGHQREIREAAVLTFVRSFVTQYTSPDPFHANDYTDKILAMGTGQFAKLYSDKINEVVVQVARAEPGVGSVQEIGIENWNDDGSANVVAVSTMITTMPDGRKLPSASRWVVTAMKEGDQWKVSNLIQVV
ncbi:MAG: mammalian cell entry protein [Mycobacterium sp.]